MGRSVFDAFAGIGTGAGKLAAASTAALGRGGREDAGVLGREEVVADEAALGAFRSFPRYLAVVAAALGSVDDLDNAGVVPAAGRPPRVFVTLEERPLVAGVVANGATDAEASTGVPPF